MYKCNKQLAYWFRSSLENLSNIFKILGDYKKLLDKIRFEDLGDSEWINSYAYMLQTETATNLGLIPICNVNSGEWLESCFIFQRETLTRLD